MSEIAVNTVNARGSKVKPLPSLERLNSIFKIIPEVQGLVWNGKTKEAGSKCLRKNGDKRQVCVGFRPEPNEKLALFPVHLIVWKMIGREIPDGHEINHIDGDVWNNSKIYLSFSLLSFKFIIMIIH